MMDGFATGNARSAGVFRGNPLDRVLRSGRRGDFLEESAEDEGDEGDEEESL